MASNTGGAKPETMNVSVTMGAPSFVPGSKVTALITLRSERPAAAEPALPASPVGQNTPAQTGLSFLTRSTSFQPETPREPPPPQADPKSALAFARLGTDEYTFVEYVVCEVAGRWTTDRSWVAPNAHVPSSDMLDRHQQPPIAAQASPTSPAPPPLDAPVVPAPVERKRYAWDAALDDANKVGGGGRLGHAGIIFRSQTLVVCEREQVPVGSQTSFAVECVLPDVIPPTLRGTAVRYSYACVVVVALPGEPAPMSIRVPFRVVSAGGYATDASVEAADASTIPVPTPASSGPVPNRFLESEESKALSMSAKLLKSTPPEDIEIALALSLNGRLTPYGTNDGLWKNQHALEDEGLSIVRDSPRISRAAEDLAGVVDNVEEDELSSPVIKPLRRKVSKRNTVPVYAITRGKDSIARMYLPKRKFLLGDTISAVFYFHKDKPCVRLGARLEVHEVVKPQFGLGTKQDTNSENGTVFRKVYGEHGEFVMMNRNTHVTFSIPYDAPASFSTDVVEIRWLIHFVFLIPQAATKLRARVAESDVIDEDEAVALLDELEIQPEDSSEDEVPGWEGGTWAGEDPTTWKQIPARDVDVLRWTLPLHVTFEPESQWGTRNSSSLRFKTAQ